MSKEITDWIKYELYPTLFESIDTALPEHNFKRYSGGWRSKTYLDGSPHKYRADKTVVTKKAPGWILENGGETLSLVDYVIKRDGVEFIQAVKTLADVVGLQLPKGEFNQESYQRYKDQATLLEDCNSYFIYCLENSTGADEVRAYLSSRGYSDEDVKAMELGYIPDQDKLFKYLLNKGYSQSLIDEVVKLNKGIGSTHRLTIPYRSGGSVKGFKFRTVGDHKPKYLNSTGLDRMGGFFNLSGIKGDKDVVIVEGELDSLSATAKGVENVVATGGNSIASDQVKDAIKRGAKSFTLCLDTEPGKEEETAKRITSAIEVILGEGVNRVYIVTLPDLGGGKTDPDRLIKESGVEAFREALSNRLTYGAYLGSKLLEEYLSKANQSGEIDYKERDLLREKVVEIRSKLSAQDRIDFNSNLVEPLSSHGFTEDLLSELEENYKTATEEAIRNKKVDELLRKVGTLPDKGEVIKELKEGLKNIDATTGKGLLPPPISFTTLLDEIATLPPAYKTGYSSLDSFIGFTPGAITLIAGRPSHGKTTFMFNLLLEMSRLYKDESFYFFTYEEPLKNISIKLLNRLIDTDLSGYFREVRDLSTPTNYEFIKSYIKARRTDISQIEEGKKQLQELIDSQRIKVIDRNYSVEELSSLIAYLNKREKIGGVFIDYIQRMKTDAKTQDMRTKIAHISDSVLQIAKESGLPIILGAQLNRATQDSKGGKPKLENLKEAGNLEEDANTVLSVYNESREKDETSEGDSYKGLREVELEIKALKNREGEVNQTALLTFDKWTGVIKNSSSSGSSYFK
ncbi:MAG: DnaB-like helicase C-terminal domain-containing protein [Sphaerochaetaceae bacterium]